MNGETGGAHLTSGTLVNLPEAAVGPCHSTRDHPHLAHEDPETAGSCYARCLNP